MRAAVSAFGLLALLAGCTAAPPRPATFEAFGGHEGLQAVVDDLIARLLQDERVAFQFAQTDLGRLRQKLAEQFCVETGGPCTYTGLSMQEAHAGRAIDAAQFNVLVEHLQDAMDARAVPVPAQNRLLRRLAPMYPDVVER